MLLSLKREAEIDELVHKIVPRKILHYRPFDKEYVKMHSASMQYNVLLFSELKFIEHMFNVIVRIKKTLAAVFV